MGSVGSRSQRDGTSRSPGFGLPLLESPPPARSLESRSGPTQSQATGVSRLCAGNSWTRTPAAPLALRALLPTGNVVGSRRALVRRVLHAEIPSGPRLCLSASRDAGAGRSVRLRGPPSHGPSVVCHAWSYSACFKSSVMCVLRGEGRCREEALCNSWPGLR